MQRSRSKRSAGSVQRLVRQDSGDEQEQLFLGLRGQAAFTPIQQQQRWLAKRLSQMSFTSDEDSYRDAHAHPDANRPLSSTAASAASGRRLRRRTKAKGRARGLQGATPPRPLLHTLPDE